jgi:hypothetical protein
VFGKGPGRTLEADDGTVLACAGITLIWPGLGEAWLLVKPEVARRYRVTLYKAIVEGLREMIAAYHLRRVQAVVIAGFPEGERLAAHLGFTEEGVMRRYDVLGRDCVRYAWLSQEMPHA